MEEATMAKEYLLLCVPSNTNCLYDVVTVFGWYWICFGAQGKNDRYRRLPGYTARNWCNGYNFFDSDDIHVEYHETG